MKEITTKSYFPINYFDFTDFIYKKNQLNYTKILIDIILLKQ